ncbi:MAG: hypothetical protein ACREK4_24800 [Candidatus Rokuibacteriota bacterium]
MSHTIAVMYLGRIVELGAAAEVALRPRHPYTQAPFSAALPLDPGERREEIILSARFRARWLRRRTAASTRAALT